MISKIAMTAFAMIALGIGGFFLLRPAALPTPSDMKKSPQSAWIEVVTPSIMEYGADGVTIQRELASGDTLTPGVTIGSAAGAKAHIHFPDGSVARLDEKSRMTLTEETFDTATNTFRVRIRLLTGRIWSKVISLATPASLWEVKTSNTVIAVRGTAFGVEFENGNSRVIGAEDTIAVAAVNPDTQDIIAGTEILLKETEMITVRETAIPNIKTRPALIRDAIISVPPAVRRERWIEDARREDEKLNQNRTEPLPERNILEENIKKDTGEKTLLPIREFTPLKKNTRPPPHQEQKSQATNPQTSSLTPQRLTIELQGGIRTLTEGDAVQLRAFVLMSDGTQRDVTKETIWQVVGSIGAIDHAMVFHAELLPSIKEIGEDVGAFVATWKDTQSGAELTGTTPILRVQPEIPQDIIPEG